MTREIRRNSFASHKPHRVVLGVAAILLATVWVPCFASQAAGGGDTPVTKAAQESPGQAANGAAVGQPTAPDPAAAVHLAALPKPLPTSVTSGIDVDTRSRSILAHLSEVIRYYRMIAVPIQKIGEPSDMLYAEQAQTAATQIAQLAFKAARDEASLLARIGTKPEAGTEQPAESETQKLAQYQVKVHQQVQDLSGQIESIDGQIRTARRKALGPLQLQKQTLEGQLKLANATVTALSRVAGISASQTNSGLQGDIDRLQHAAPELVDRNVKPVAHTIEALGSLRDAGVTSQATVLFQLVGTEHAIDERLRETQTLHDQALDLRTPLIKILRATIDAGQKVQPPATSDKESDADRVAETRKAYDQLADAFEATSDVSVPISQEVLLLEQARANLSSWRAAVDAERTTILNSLLLRVIVIAATLVLIFGLGRIWQKATTRYVHDVRRRRQLLLVRRLVIGFLSGVVVILGFVSQFNSLATFAGFITAGIAVGLQTMLLSVAAYFLIVGRYGVRVGDRITVAGVTGDVVEVGLVRFYMMELTGSGTELHPTGRIAVFANSVLFQAGTPLYKQIPGTDYVWHEVTVKLRPGTDYGPATDVVRNAIQKVYDRYREKIEQQHRQVETWMDTALEAPRMETRLQLSDGLQFAVLYPVQIADAAATDEQIVREMMSAMAGNEAVKEAVDGTPTLRAVVKG